MERYLVISQDESGAWYVEDFDDYKEAEDYTPHPTEKDGRVFWNNELAFVVTPDKADYATVVHGGEIIIDGPVTGTGEPQQAQTHPNPPEAETYGQPFPSEDETLPF